MQDFLTKKYERIKFSPAQNEILCPKDSEGGREKSPFMKKQREGG